MSIFALSGSIDPNSTMDEDDVFNTKSALNTLGHFKTPKHGLTRFPDQPMIDGVKSFQRSNGLRVDGVVKPDGPTQQRVNQRLAEKQAADEREKLKADQKRAQLEAQLSAAHHNRREAHKRAGQKEAEFQVAKNATNQAWARVKAEGLKLGIQVSLAIVTRRGRISAPSLAAAVDGYVDAADHAQALTEEVKTSRQDVDDWDSEIKTIRGKLRLMN